MIFKGFENSDSFHCLKVSVFKFAKSGGVLMVRLIVDQKAVDSNPIHGRWAEIFHIELGLKIRVSVLP